MFFPTFCCAYSLTFEFRCTEIISLVHISNTRCCKTGNYNILNQFYGKYLCPKPISFQALAPWTSPPSGYSVCIWTQHLQQKTKGYVPQASQPCTRYRGHVQVQLPEGLCNPSDIAFENNKYWFINSILASITALSYTSITDNYQQCHS